MAQWLGGGGGEYNFLGHLLYVFYRNHINIWCLYHLFDLHNYVDMRMLYEKDLKIAEYI